MLVLVCFSLSPFNSSKLCSVQFFPCTSNTNNSTVSPCFFHLIPKTLFWCQFWILQKILNEMWELLLETQLKQLSTPCSKDITLTFQNLVGNLHLFTKSSESSWAKKGNYIWGEGDRCTGLATTNNQWNSRAWEHRKGFCFRTITGRYEDEEFWQNFRQ